HYYLHRLHGTTRPGALPPPHTAQKPRAGADVLNKAYSDLLARLPLSVAHRAALRQRGLSDAEIDRRGYRTLFIQGRARLARELRDQIGDGLLSVPGFAVKQGKAAHPYLTITGAA